METQAYTPKELEVARVIEEFKAHRITGKIILNFKSGQLMSGVKEQSF